MDRKKLGIIASALALFALMLWSTQGYDEGAQAAASTKGTISATSSITASAAPSAAPRKTASAGSGTPQPQSHSTLAAQTSQRHTAANSTAHNEKTGSDTNNNASSSQSPTQTKERIKPAPLEPRAEPYALMANNGSATVRFSVRLIGDADPSSTVYLRQGGAEGVTALNDQGVNGDIVAGDNIHGGNIVLDTSRLQPDTCLSYFAALKDGENETGSSPLSLCISSFPVRVATPNTINPIVFEDGMKAVADDVLLYVVPTTSAARIQQLAQSINAAVVGSIIPLNMYQLRLPSPVDENQMAAIISQLNAQEGVVGASVNALGESAGHVTVVTDPEFAIQHGVQLVSQHPILANSYVWDVEAIGTGVTVVVADYGLDRTHPDFGTPGNCQLSTDAATGVANTDCGGTNNDNAVAGIYQWHGTRVAGVLAAKALNGQGIAGVAHGSKIYSYKVASFALTDMDQIFTDVGNYVAMNSAASVINASFSGGPYTGALAAPGVTALCEAINTAVTSGSGAIVVNAAGNNSSNGFYYPSRCNEHAALLPANRNRLISVGNSASIVTRRCGNAPIDQLCLTDLDDATKLGSNFGAWVEIAAPGSDIRTTISGAAYANATGTSFSAPMVSGAVAILKSCGVPLDQIESTLRTSANVTVPFPDGSSAPRLDIYRALAQVNHTPTAVNLSNNSLNDGTNTTSGLEVGTLSRTDPDTCDKHTYSITGGADAAKFSIGGTASDRLILADGVLHYATKPSYTVTVQVRDFFGATFNQTLTVNVAAVNHAPTISNQTFRINEGSANGTAVGTVLASDPDSGNVLTYSITAGNTSSAFSINAGTGALIVNNATALVYATNPTFSLTVRVTDGGGLSANATVTVNVNKAPTISNQLFSINEGTANSASVGAVNASDAGDTLSYSITAGNTSSAFSINSSTGVISVSNSGALIYATNPSFSLTVRITDSGNLSASATVTVNVNAPGAPANNAPVIANQTFVVDDGSANGTAVGSVIAGDPDAGDSLSYSITGGNTGGAFALNATTGALTVSNALSYATTPTYALTARVADNGGLSTTATVTVNVNAASAPPADPDNPPDPANPPASSGGGGCSVMPVGTSPDSSLALVVLVLLGYGVRRRKS